ncbi:MAG: sulfatase-like hydrolase/transferase [Nitrospiraceae bacterium]|nr:sulfatase-like hydrolase/transferase [Nitrospiraceae bacterium]
MLFILTDDQGYGDLGYHGNKDIRTPQLDAFCAQSVAFTDFHVSPVCSPTRACLLTGRYNHRTGVIDVSHGRATLRPDEVTLADSMGAAGYRTGIFGKWHLGDNYPLRPIDQGFQEALVHRGGGISQKGGPHGNTYLDPILEHNGKAKKYKGYCTDVFTDAAMQFIQNSGDEPFFVYLPTNCPHTPLQIEDKWVAPYEARGIDPVTAKYYGMVTNIDYNVGRLLVKLQELGLERDTIVVFMTDNGADVERGPIPRRYSAGLRGKKGTPYEGGIRVPCYFRWPGVFEPDRKIDRHAAHIDFLPTILDLCHVERREGFPLDGLSLAPLLMGEAADWPDRTIFIHLERNRHVPEKYLNCSARNQRYKMVNGVELYDMSQDPGEQHDLAGEKPKVLAQLNREYEAWFDDIMDDGRWQLVPNYVGDDHQNPVTLSLMDRRRPSEGSPDGHYEVDVRRAGSYEIKVDFYETEEETCELLFKLGSTELRAPLGLGVNTHTFTGVELKKGLGQLYCRVTGKLRNAKPLKFYIHMKRL